MSPLAARLRPAALALLAASAIAAIGAVVWIARSRAEPPARCAPGMIALGPRCCGEGQHLDGERCAGAPSRCAAPMSVTEEGCVASTKPLRIEGGTLRVGPGDWEAQGVIAPHQANVATFLLDSVEVNEQRYARCVRASACAPVPLTGEPGRAVSGVTLAEAQAFCRWDGGALPTRDQLAFAAAGPSGRRYPWGDTGAVCRRAAWGLVRGPCGEGATSPELGGAHPDGASPDGALDLAGNVAEWTLPASEGAPMTEVRGGSFADGAASGIRSWQRRVVPVDTRSPEVGFRCVHEER